MYKVKRYQITKIDYSKGYYNPDTKDIHDFEPISERDLIILLIEHGKEHIVDFLMYLVENPYTWGTVNETEKHKEGHISIIAMWEPK